jgi:hypothetical protein
MHRILILSMFILFYAFVLFWLLRFMYSSCFVFGHTKALYGLHGCRANKHPCVWKISRIQCTSNKPKRGISRCFAGSPKYSSPLKFWGWHKFAQMKMFSYRGGIGPPSIQHIKANTIITTLLTISYVLKRRVRNYT